MPKIAIVGAGWYGCHIALELAKAGHDVTVFEENDDLFRGLSGEYGIRLHRGPHYPRSTQTRESCHRGFDEFIATYPELVIKNSHSIYSLSAVLDADGKPPKVDAATFKAVCEETKTCRTADPKEFGYENLESAYDMDEPSLAVGDKLREYFRKRLANAGVKFVRGCKVEKVERKDNKSYINDNEEGFEEVVNATSYQSLLPSPHILPDTEVVYQPCLALVYEDTQPSKQPFSSIIMDGSYPCIMPYSEGMKKSEDGNQQYIVTHGKHTIAGSFSTPEAAQALLYKLHKDDTFIKSYVRPNSEKDMARFWPEFTKRFIYRGWKGKVVPKFKTEREYRSAVTFKDQKDLIHVIPGKVSNIFDAARDVLAFVENKNVIHENNYSYVKGSELDQSAHEIKEKPFSRIQNTCDIQTYQDWFRENIQAERGSTLVARRLNHQVFFSPNHPQATKSHSFPIGSQQAALSHASTQRLSAKL
jgi:predicted NAD/FAD-dependent oxidoreductase